MVLYRTAGDGAQLLQLADRTLVDRFERCDSSLGVINLLVEPLGREVLPERARKPSEMDLGIVGTGWNYVTQDVI